jgi:hypothetical protein
MQLSSQLSRPRRALGQVCRPLLLPLLPLLPLQPHRALHYPANASSASGNSPGQDGRGGGIRLSWSKELMSRVVPLTGELIGTNQLSFEGAAVRYFSESLSEEGVSGPVPDPSSPPPPGHGPDATAAAAGVSAVPKARYVEDSWVEIILPFSDHLKLRTDMMLADRKV